jgi:DNA-binding GntR family transcriptional regulator
MSALGTIGADASLREKVTQRLRAAIVTGDLRPGTVYSAPSLAARFGVSATPVREAMLDLAKGGFVEVARNKGFRVIDLSDDDLDEIAAIRALLEVPTMRDIAKNIDSATIARARPRAAAIEVAAAEGDLTTFTQLDTDFHLDLLGVLGNKRLVSIVHELRMSTRLGGLHQLMAEGRLTATAREHVMLLDMLETHNADGAVALMRQHIGHVRGAWAGRREHFGNLT